MMTEESVGFLYKLSSSISIKSKSSNSKTLEYLKSYYLMRCHKLTKSYGLPSKQFSNFKRCSHCCLEWKPNNYITKIKSTKLSKKQRRKHKLKGEGKTNSNTVERVCLLCKKTTVFKIDKPSTDKQGNFPKSGPDRNKYIVNLKVEKNQIIPEQTKNKSEINVYTNTKSIFALDNKSNKIAQYVIPSPTVIKNNKRKKDKFAGLCKEAVLSAAKIANAKDKNKQLNLFLKPSQ